MSVGGVVGVQRDHPITGCSSCHSEGNAQCRRRGRSDDLWCHLDRLLCHRQRDHRNRPHTEYLWRRSAGFNDGISLLSCYATGNVTSTGSSTGYVHIGGFLGDNYITVTACYWKNNHEQGIGYNRESTKATKVDGTSVTWQKAVDAMNTALQKQAQSGVTNLKEHCLP